MALRKRRLAEWLRLLNTKTFGRPSEGAELLPFQMRYRF